MPHSQSGRADGARPDKDQPDAQQATTPEPGVPVSANGHGNGNGNGHDRRRSGRVTYRPKAAEMLTVHARTEDERLLASSARPAFLDSDPWRSLRILAEFVEGFDALAAVGKAVTIFGSARMPRRRPVLRPGPRARPDSSPKRASR